MRAKSLALLILALGCGLVASIGITQVMNARGTGDSKSADETRPVFVAVKDIPLGEPLAAEVVKLEQWPKDQPLEGAIGKIEDLEGRKCKTILYAGEPILERKLGDPNKASTLIPPGYRVVSVRVDSVSSGGGLIGAGDRVDLLVHMVRNPSRGIMQTSTRTFLQDVKVFAVNGLPNPEAASDEDRSKDVKVVSLLVTPAQAQEVMFNGELGKIQLVMRSSSDDNLDHVGETGFAADEPKDTTKDETADASKKDLEVWLKQLGKTQQQAKSEQTDVQVTADPTSHKIRIIDGPEIYDVELHSDLNGDPLAVGSWTIDNPVRQPVDPQGEIDGTYENQIDRTDQDQIDGTDRDQTNFEEE